MKKKVSPKIILKNGGLFMGLIILTLYIILKNNNMEDIIKSISSVDINSLSVKEAFDFISNLKSESQNILSKTTQKDIV